MPVKTLRYNEENPIDKVLLLELEKNSGGNQTQQIRNFVLAGTYLSQIDPTLIDILASKINQKKTGDLDEVIRILQSDLITSQKNTGVPSPTTTVHKKNDNDGFSDLGA
ncbi:MULTISPECIES: hypothetical protein [Vibrio]|uniref:Plasmid stability protein n=1 Tax=Vibrio splendidus TaxID=29497 RepID=A0A2N7JWS0_VIBSP|nr:hypothetical protein [Vibrio splendidus]PMM64280.1 hypothetical protein BCT54_17850 [Vibrio splendidus]